MWFLRSIILFSLLWGAGSDAKAATRTVPPLASVTFKLNCEHKATTTDFAAALKEAEKEGNTTRAEQLRRVVQPGRVVPPPPPGFTVDTSAPQQSPDYLGSTLDYSRHCELELGWQGEITPDAADRVKEIIDIFEAHRHGQKTLVDVFLNPQGHSLSRIFGLNSKGGSVLGAMSLGRLIRAHQLLTNFDSGTTCLSACVLAYLGGVGRGRALDHGPVGVHRPYFDAKYFAGLSYEQAAKKQRELEDMVRAYLDELHISPELSHVMFSVPSSQVRILTDEELRQYGVSGDDPVYLEWKAAKLKARVGDEGVTRIRALDKEIEAINERCQAEFPFTRNDPDLNASARCFYEKSKALIRERDRLCGDWSVFDCVRWVDAGG